MASRYELSEAQWERIKDFLPGRKEHVAPSPELRECFHHAPKRWNEFRRRYFAKLKHHKDALSPILEAVHNCTVTLLYSSHDMEHNNAVVGGVHPALA